VDFTVDMGAANMGKTNGTFLDLANPVVRLPLGHGQIIGLFSLIAGIA
jgi:hypothetical protein